ncbi:hypothetical protein [Caldifermentibacillus hisashii]|uniref:hypothetical protein n=1 Tax=Caldifermentibacillus hisashii TaxID=996558 RepID=UPI0031B706EB
MNKEIEMPILLGQSKKDKKSPKNKILVCALLFLYLIVLAVVCKENFFLFLISCVIFILLASLEVMFKYLTYLHEFCHKKIANIFGHQAVIIIDREKLDKIEKVIGNKIDGFCNFEDQDEFKKHHFILIVLAPLMFFACLLIILLFLFIFQPLKYITLTIMFLLILKLDGMTLDFVMAKQVIKYRKTRNMIIYDESKYSFYYKK